MSGIKITRSNGARRKEWHRRLNRLLLTLGVSLALPVQAGTDVLDLQLEDLLKVEIKSASRKLQHVQDVSAAVFVITREDIDRSGAQTIPDALRLAPGVEVARIGNNRWAVSIRGFNGRFANKMLVLKDGRSVYSPLFSGVMWEDEDVILADVDRIEVIRGPSAAMWGSNAVNGVINIISLDPSSMLGTEISASSGTDQPGSVTVRHGMKVGNGHVRISAKVADLDPAHTSSGDQGNDSWRNQRLGLHANWPAADGGNWMLVGEAYQSRADDRLDYTRYGRVPPLFDIQQADSGSSLLLRREQATGGGGNQEWQLSAQTSVSDLESLIHVQQQTVAGEFQQSLPSGAHELMWGGAYRLSRDDIQLPGSVMFDLAKFEQQQRDWRLASFFVHDDYALLPRRWQLSGGVRVDFDSWSGTQVQPDIRLAYTPSASSTWWTSLARASRTPSRLELDVPFLFSETPAVPPATPAVDTVRVPPAAGSLKAEIVTALEAGWRSRVNAELSLDLSVFTADYSDVVSMSTQPMQMVSPVVVVVPLTSINGAKVHTQGFELAADWQVRHDWRLQSIYSRLYLSSPALADPAAAAEQSLWIGRVARERASLRSAWTLNNGHQLDLWLRHVSGLSNPPVPAYTELDLRYAVPLGGHGNLILIGQNLLNRRHPEFVSDYLPIQQTEVGRSLLLKATWHF